MDFDLRVKLGVSRRIIASVKIKMKSKTKIDKQTSKKFNSDLVETVRLCKKNKNWLEVAGKLSSPRKNKIQANLLELQEDCVVCGKVLGSGEAKKLKVVAFSFSDSAMKKINKAGGNAVKILDEIKQNPDMKGLKILK